jgi:hypothetical protein
MGQKEGAELHHDAGRELTGPLTTSRRGASDGALRELAGEEKGRRRVLRRRREEEEVRDWGTERCQ